MYNSNLKDKNNIKRKEKFWEKNIAYSLIAWYIARLKSLFNLNLRINVIRYIQVITTFSTIES